MTMRFVSGIDFGLSRVFRGWSVALDLLGDSPRIQFKSLVIPEVQESDVPSSPPRTAAVERLEGSEQGPASAVPLRNGTSYASTSRIEAVCSGIDSGPTFVLYERPAKASPGVERFALGRFWWMTPPFDLEGTLRAGVSVIHRATSMNSSTVRSPISSGYT
jgi:hypothetical protein